MTGISKGLLTVLMLMPLAISARTVMYVPSGEANDVVVIDLENDKIIGRIEELENAHGLSASATGDYLVAGGMQAAEAGKQSPSKPSAVGEEEHRAHHAGVPGEEGGGFVSIVHLKQGHVMRRLPVRAPVHHTAVSVDGRHAVAVHSGAGGISVIDLDKMTVIRTVQTGARPNYALFSSDGKRLYVSNAGPGTISEIAIADWSVTREIPVGKEPEHFVLAADGATLYVAEVGDGTVSSVDLARGRVMHAYAVGGKPHGVALSDDGRRLFISSLGASTLTRIDLAGGAMETLDLQPAPYHVAYADNLNKLYVSSRRAPKIWVIDPKALAVRGVIDIHRGVAHQMVIREE